MNIAAGSQNRSVSSCSTLTRGLLALIISCVITIAHANEDGIHQVLFVGNSFSFYNNGVHNHYKHLYASSRPTAKVRTRLLSLSGATLDEHRGLPEVLEREPWDLVVLQGHSRGPLDNYSQFQIAAVNHAEAIRAAGAEPVMFATWAYTGQPEMTAKLLNAYKRAAKTIDATLVPVGSAFAVATKLRPELALRTGDKKHPTLAGSYLAACVFLAALTGDDPQGLDYTAGLDADTALFLQQVAWKTVQTTKKQ